MNKAEFESPSTHHMISGCHPLGIRSLEVDKATRMVVGSWEVITNNTLQS